MKRWIVAFVLVAGVAAIAFASFNNKNKKANTEKKTEKNTRECKHSCMFS